MTEASNIGIVILAAGSSSRLGRPKQLLKYENKTLLQRMIDMVAPFECSPKVLVLGANAEQIRDATNLETVVVLDNELWFEGIASSINSGVKEAMKLNSSLDSILFLLSDQPFVTTELIRKLLNEHKKGNQGITACRYKGSIGVPAIFRRSFFQELQELSGDVGAKKIIMQHRDDVSEVPFRKGAFDIDTLEDYNQLREN